MKPAAPVIRIGPLDVNACPQRCGQTGPIFADSPRSRPEFLKPVENLRLLWQAVDEFNDTPFSAGSTPPTGNCGASGCKARTGRMRQQRIEPVDLSLRAPAIHRSRTKAAGIRQRKCNLKPMLICERGQGPSLSARNEIAPIRQIEDFIFLVILLC